MLLEFLYYVTTGVLPQKPRFGTSSCLRRGKPGETGERHRCHGAIDMTGGFKHVSPGFVGEMIQFGEHIFQGGWFNHQL